MNIVYLLIMGKRLNYRNKVLIHDYDKKKSKYYETKYMKIDEIIELFRGMNVLLPSKFGNIIKFVNGTHDVIYKGSLLKSISKQEIIDLHKKHNLKIPREIKKLKC